MTLPDPTTVVDALVFAFVAQRVVAIVVLYVYSVFAFGFTSDVDESEG